MMIENSLTQTFVRMLVEQSKDYEAAANIVRDAERVFARHSKALEKKVDALEISREIASVLELQMILQDAGEDIESHRQWQSEVWKMLPSSERKSDNPLVSAFERTGLLRDMLASRIMSVEKTFLVASN